MVDIKSTVVADVDEVEVADVSVIDDDGKEQRVTMPRCKGIKKLEGALQAG